MLGSTSPCVWYSVGSDYVDLILGVLENAAAEHVPCLHGVGAGRAGVNIRVARNREFPLPQKLRDILQQRFIGMLLMGEPDSGKTTLLRGVARELAKQNRAVAVIDERREIFPSEESAALPLDILSGIPKGQAVQMALRTLSPQVILLDELGGMDELYALEQGLFSGVEFIATLHAASWEEAARRPQVQYLQKCGALHVAVLLKGRTAPGQLKEVRAS